MLGPARLVKGELVSNAVAYPQAMPVEVAPVQELTPFFDFLRNPAKLGERWRGRRRLTWGRFRAHAALTCSRSISLPW